LKQFFLEEKMAQKTKTFSTADTAAVTSALSGNNMTYTLERNVGVLDYEPSGVYSKHQISMSGLGTGGTFDVKIWQPGAVQYTTHQSNSTADDAVMVEGPLAKKIQVVVTGGSGANPKLHFTSVPRMS